jgi:tetraacyldisaccharide 4'-kinase
LSASLAAPPSDDSKSLRHRYLALIRGRSRGPVASLCRLLLWLASGAYGLVVAVRNRLYDAGWLRSEKASVPVVSVGNLTAGGTGKTPCVEYVAGFYRSRQLRVAVLSRGYGATGGANDEALVLEDNLPDVPHLQGPDRVALAASAVEELETEMIVLDDGFQHRRLARDLDLVLIDATDPWGGGLLPRGLLREPRSGLRRAGVVLLTRTDQVQTDRRDRLRRDVARLAPGVPIAETRHHPVECLDADGTTTSLAELVGRPVAAFCGIGNPDAFRQTLVDLGADVRVFRTFPDHHPYARADVAALEAWAKTLPADALVLTTQKDLVKLRIASLSGRPLRALRVRFQVDAGKEALEDRLQAVASAC